LAALRNERERQHLAAIRASRIMRRRIRDMSDPFALPEREFIGMYRLTKHLTRALIQQLQLYLPVRRGPLAIPIELRVRRT